jgi:hypothetical protein
MPVSALMPLRRSIGSRRVSAVAAPPVNSTGCASPVRAEISRQSPFEKLAPNFIACDPVT